MRPDETSSHSVRGLERWRALLWTCSDTCVSPRDDRPHLRRRTVGAAPLLVLIPVASAIPALAALALVSSVCSLVVALEVIRYRESRVRVRHPEPLA